MTFTAWGMTSWPMPSPGMTAMRFFCEAVREFIVERTTKLLRCGTWSLSGLINCFKKPSRWKVAVLLYVVDNQHRRGICDPVGCDSDLTVARSFGCPFRPMAFRVDKFTVTPIRNIRFD